MVIIHTRNKIVSSGIIFGFRCLFFNLAAQPNNFPESNNDVPPLISPNNANNNMENPLDISEFDEVANFSGYKSEELFPEVDLRATESELADMEENSVELISRITSESMFLPNEHIVHGKASF